MDLIQASIEGYRSIRSIHLPFRRLTVLVGGNGVGKTNLYRALHLVHSAACGTFSTELAAEGGLQSAVWAGERRTHEKSGIKLGVKLDNLGADDFGSAGFNEPSYEFEVGFTPAIIPGSTVAAFPLEAEVKSETLRIRSGRRKIIMMERKGRTISVRNDKGVRTLIEDDLLASETALFTLGTTATYLEISAMRRALSQWRFYHNFRTDAQSPIRRPAPAVTTPMLLSDGSNLAAVFATLRHIRGDSADLDQAIDDAFPGARLIVPLPGEHATFALTYPDFPKREFGVSELSDGTVQYLALMGALLSYRPPPFMALNEPEASLHPSVLPALGRLIAKAAKRTQILVVTHSKELARAIEDEAGAPTREVIKREGATWISGLSNIGLFEDE